MGYNKLTGSQAIFGAIAATSSLKFVGDVRVESATTDATLGGIKLGGATAYIRQVPFTNASWTTSVTTNFNAARLLPAKAIVTDAYVDITAKATVGTSNITLTAGTTGDPNGFLVGIATTAVGTKGGSLATGAITYGALLVETLLPTCGTIKVRRDHHVGATAQNIAIGRSSTKHTAALAGNLYITYIVPE